MACFKTQAAFINSILISFPNPRIFFSFVLMLTLQNILQILRQHKPALQKKYGVKDIALFGSYSRNTAVAGKSDVDVMVAFSQPIGLAFVDLADELEQLLQTRVDLVSRNGIKPKYFTVIEPDLIYV